MRTSAPREASSSKLSSRKARDHIAKAEERYVRQLRQRERAGRYPLPQSRRRGSPGRRQGGYLAAAVGGYRSGGWRAYACHKLP
jgi:hypothetical protein